jgi:hypothetical protein
MLPGREHDPNPPSAPLDEARTDRPLACPVCPAPARRHGGLGTPLPRWARIVIASVFLTTAAAAVVTHGLLMRWNTQTWLELDAMRAAADGAVFLPGAPARALSAAIESAELRGLSLPDVTHVDVAADRMSLSVTLRRTAPSLMLRLLHSASVDATATVRARPSATPRGSDGAPWTLSMGWSFPPSPHRAALRPEPRPSFFVAVQRPGALLVAARAI